MLKLIGMIVVVAVVMIGYPALSRWYAGDASPQETVEDVRNRVGTALISEGKSGGGQQQQSQQQSPQQSTQGGAAPAAPTDSREPVNASQMIKNMMKD